MGRVRQNIQVDGLNCRTLFDTGARNTYVTRDVARALVVKKEEEDPIRTKLGGGVRESRETAVLSARIEGHRVSTHAVVLDEIVRDEDGKTIEVLFGALAMRQWGIRPVPDREELDLTHYPSEFVEY